MKPEYLQKFRAYLEVDLSIIADNVNLLRDYFPKCTIQSVVKGDAYGLGAVEVAKKLNDIGVNSFAVDTISEGIALRNSGVVGEIMVIDGGLSSLAEQAIEYNLSPGIPNIHLLNSYERAAKALNKKIPIWIVANVGFNRSGYNKYDEFRGFLENVVSCKFLQTKGVYSHLSNADNSHDANIIQIEKYFECLELTRSVLGESIASSLFASHGILRWASKYQTDYIRPGVIMYGEHMFDELVINDSLKEALMKFKSCIKVKAQVSEILHFNEDNFLGYGRQHVVRANQSVVTIPVGFADGYPSGANEKPAILNGALTRTIGATGMTAMQVDATGNFDVSIGNWVTLIGREAGVELTARDVAKASGLSIYELLSRLKLKTNYI